MSGRKCFILLVVVACLMFSGHVAACDKYYSPHDEQSWLVVKTNLYGAGLITLWGLAKWDYFSRSPHADSEGLFGNTTKSGGADKLGHFYTSYIVTHGLSYFYEQNCINRRNAAFYGALSSFAILGYMEVGDSFSDFGFSNEDFIINALGSVAGYFLYQSPSLSKKIDIRWEYGFHSQSDDFTTDYENTKYLVAIKLNGFENTRTTFLKHLELHLGYYTRGFSDPLDSRERNLYLGLGVNLTDLLWRNNYKKTATVLKYIQLPGTYVEFTKDINK